MNAKMIKSALAYTPGLPAVLLPDKIRSKFLATVLSLFNLRRPASLVALIPSSPASLTSLTKLSKLAIG